MAGPIYRFVIQQIAKNIGKKEGITTILRAKDKRVAASVEQITQTLTNMGVDVSKIKSPDEVKKYLNIHNSWVKQQTPKVIGQGHPEFEGITEALFGKKKATVTKLPEGGIDRVPVTKQFTGQSFPKTSQEKIDWLVKNVSSEGEVGIPPKETLEQMLKDGRGDLIDHFYELHTKDLGRPPKIKIDRSELKHPDLVEAIMKEKSKPTLVPKKPTGQSFTADDHIKFIKSKEPIESMKEANALIGRKNPSYKGRYKNITDDEAKQILKDVDDHIFQRDVVE